MFSYFSKNAAHGRGDIGRRESSGRDLVEERLKKVIIGAVDHGHADRFVAEMLGRLETAEAGADDDDVRFGGLWVSPSSK